ncbi:MAG: transposase [Alphaproteobacteria bacterium]|nr:transposase [Alphaproteobacteria bacterium]
MITYESLPDDEYEAANLLAEIRWPGGGCCPRCGNGKFSHLRTRPRVFVCTRCQLHRSVTAGTPLARCHVPLCKVLRAAWLLARPRSISARKLGFKLRMAYETAWSLCHRLRVGQVFCDLDLGELVSLATINLRRRPPPRQPWIHNPLNVTLLVDDKALLVPLPGRVGPHEARRFIDRHSAAERVPVAAGVRFWVVEPFFWVFAGTHRHVSDRFMPLYAAAVAAWERARRTQEDPVRDTLAATLRSTLHPFARVRPRQAAEFQDLRDWRSKVTIGQVDPSKNAAIDGTGSYS